MVVSPKYAKKRTRRTRNFLRSVNVLLWWVTSAFALLATSAPAQAQNSDWRKQARQFAEQQDWVSALRVVEQEIARSPQDTDILAWRARILSWSGRLAEAEAEYLKLLNVSERDPDLWLGLANVYLRQGKTKDAVRALDTAVTLDPERADLHLAHGRALLADRQPRKASKAFQVARILAQGSSEVRAALSALRLETKHELRFGQENDIFNFAGPNHLESVGLTSRWNENWSTSVSAQGYQRGGAEAQRFVASVAARAASLCAVTLGGAGGHHNGVIPKSEAFFELDRGAGIGVGSLRGVEFAYSQHWYWYDTARILTLSGTTLLYFPHDWTLTLAATGARSAFSGTTAEWRPSGVARITFPLAGWAERHVSGNLFFAAGTENFARVDQIGRFASQTYGGGLRLQLTTRQDINAYASYQKRSQAKTDANFGFSYGIRF
jgi:tetratricopeptide (TPR) repeat protein